VWCRLCRHLRLDLCCCFVLVPHFRFCLPSSPPLSRLPALYLLCPSPPLYIRLICKNLRPWILHRIPRVGEDGGVAHWCREYLLTVFQGARVQVPEGGCPLSGPGQTKFFAFSSALFPKSAYLRHQVRYSYFGNGRRITELYSIPPLYLRPISWVVVV
jgi:hypothetical protein